ncbi:MAG: methyltransferase domain-containing protein [Candidatus Binatia bacterium]
METLFEAQVELYRPKARLLRRWLAAGPEIRVVEVGSFVGGFLAAGQEYSWNMLGIDPGEEVDAFCRGKGLHVFRGTLSEASLETNSIDCVAIWNTFDQLPYPDPTLTAARRVLRPGGIMAVRVPNGVCFRLVVAWTRRLPRPLRGWLRAALAWNNLLAFPYLYGYSVRTLDALFSRFDLQRVFVQPDTLTRLADAQTKTWAAWEESMLKLFWRFAARLDALRLRGALAVAPWVDAYYRLPD